MDDAAWVRLLRIRATDPAAVAKAWAQRARRPLLGPDGRLFLLAADHPARGALRVGDYPLAMADRRELDDPLTGHDPRAVIEQGLDGGKMLLRLDLGDRDSVTTLRACAAWVSELARAGVSAMVEPLPYRRRADGELDRSEEALVRAVTVAAGLGASSAWTWLKLPAWPSTPAACAASPLPALVLGGVPSGDLVADLAGWRAALRLPTVRGLVVGRALLYPPDGDVHAAVRAAAREIS